MGGPTFGGIMRPIGPMLGGGIMPIGLAIPMEGPGCIIPGGMGTPPIIISTPGIIPGGPPPIIWEGPIMPMPAMLGYGAIMLGPAPA